MTSSAGAQVKTETPLAAVQTSVERCIEALWLCSLVVEEPSSNEQLHKNINEFLASLRSLDRDSRRIDHKIPMSVVQAVDQGNNPDQMTKDLLEAARAKNDALRGKVFATKVLKDQFDARLRLWDEATRSKGGSGGSGSSNDDGDVAMKTEPGSRDGKDAAKS